MRVLITAGGTEEPIDGVRSITNTSTGATGAAIAEHFASRGASVTHLCGRRAIRPAASSLCEIRTYSDFKSLDSLLEKVLSESDFDAVVHAAAVSDYSVAKIICGAREMAPSPDTKIESRAGEEISLILKKNHKIIDRLRSYSRNANVVVVGFKLTNTKDTAAREAAVRTLFSGGAADMVVHNDLSGIFEGSHEAVLHLPSGPAASFKTKAELASGLYSAIENAIGGKNL